MRFYLGAHRTSWLGRTAVPLFVSHRPLALRKSYPRALGEWIQDSGGFTELSMFGGWTTPIDTYIANTRRHRDEIGNMLFAAPQDWMCEDVILAQAGKTVHEHIRLTVHNLIELRSKAPDVPWMPVLQGFAPDDYLHCFETYTNEGIHLADEPLVGIGSVCRRQSTTGAAQIIRTFTDLGVSLHAFGYKTQGLDKTAPYLASADSMAWSYAARRRPAIAGHSHKNCANCLEYALAWRERIVAKYERAAYLRQSTLWAA